MGKAELELIRHALIFFRSYSEFIPCREQTSLFPECGFLYHHCSKVIELYYIVLASCAFLGSFQKLVLAFKFSTD